MTVQKLLNELTDEIAHFESDTFSSSRSKLTKKEIKAMVELSLTLAVDWFLDNLDGYQMQQLLQNVREED